MSDDPVKRDEPFDRLTNLANDMIQQLNSTEGTDDVRAIVLTTDGEKGGIGMTGYDPDDPAALLADVMQQVSALFAAYGIKMMPMPLPKGIMN